MVNTTANKEAFYVGLKDPNEFRREVLSASKSVIVLLKRFEKSLDNQKIKIELEIELTKRIRQLNFLVARLRKSFPEHKLRSIPVNKPAVRKDRIAVQEAKTHHLSEMEKLERELQKIEHKIKQTRK